MVDGCAKRDDKARAVPAWRSRSGTPNPPSPTSAGASHIPNAEGGQFSPGADSGCAQVGEASAAHCFFQRAPASSA